MKKILVIIFFLTITFPMLSQWQQINGLYGGNVRVTAIMGNEVFAGTNAGGVYLSTDNGDNWVQKNKGLPSLMAWCLVVKDNYLITGLRYDGIYISSDNGNNWIEKNNGIVDQDISTIAIDGNNIYAGTYNGKLYYSSNNGNIWIEIGFNNLPNNSIYAIAISGNNIFVSTGTTLFLSIDNGSNWNKITSLADLPIESLEINGNNIYAGSSQGNIYLSTDNGNNWRNILNTATTDAPVFSIKTVGNNVYASIYHKGVYLSTDNGNTWLQKANGWDFYNIQCISINGNNLYVSSFYKGVLVSTDNGDSWTKKNNGLNISGISKIVFSGNNIFAGTYEGEIFLSTDNGNSWDFKYSVLTYYNITSLVVNGNNVFFTTTGAYFYSSNDNGNTWSQKSIYPTSFAQYGSCIAIKGNDIFAGTENGVLLSTNNGDNWIQKNNGIMNLSIYSLVISGNNIFVGSNNGIYLSSDNGDNWIPENNGLTNLNINTLLISGNNIYAGTQDGLFLSSDNGNNWSPINCGLTYRYIRNMEINGSNIFVGAYDYKINISQGDTIIKSFPCVYLSTDNGSSWNYLSTLKIQISELTAKGDDIYAGTGASIWKASISQLINSMHTISINSINTSYCNGDTMFIPFSIKGNFISGNIFTVQLSDSFGMFYFPIDIGSINSTTAGTIIAKISDSIPQRNNYRIRVVSSNPEFNGRDNCFDIAIGPHPNPSITSGDSIVCNNSIVTYKSIVKPGVTFQWSASGGNLQGSSTNDSVNILWNTSGKGIVKLTEANSLSCMDTVVKNIIINPLPIKPVITHLQNKLQSTLALSYQWYYGGNPIQGEVNREYIPLLPGSYTVEITDSNGCLAMSDAYIMGNGAYLFTSNNPIIFPIDCQSSSQNTLSISNGGNQDLSVIEAVIEGNNASDFQITTDLNNYSIKAKETGQITFTFKPPGIGDRSAILKLKTNAENVSDEYFLINLNARKDSVGFILSTTQIDLDTLDENTPVTKNIILTNTGTVPLYWQYPVTIGEFKIESINPDTTQPYGGKSTIKITFQGGQRNTRYVRSYQFTEPICLRSVKLDLSARVGVIAIPSTISINNGDTVRASAGDEVEIPIFISNKSILYSSGIITVEGDVKTNANLLYPSSGTDLGKIDSLNDRVIHLNMPIDSSQNPIIETLRFKAMLGNDSTTILALENLKGLPYNIDFTEIKNGVFLLTGICREGGARLIGPGPATSIIINPNPVSNSCKIEYETYSGNAKLYIVNSYGQTVKTFVNGGVSAGWHTVYYDLTNVPSDVYFVILQSETKIKTVRMDVVK